MVIAHNISAMNTQRQLQLNVNDQSKSTEKLSSGYKINRAADDASGLTISEKMRWQIRGLNRGAKNIQDGNSLCQVADGALEEVSSMIKRVKELSVQGANDTNTSTDREAINKEIEQILSEVDRISSTTTFNEMPLFQGNERIVYGADGNPVISSSIPFSDISLADISLGNGPFTSSSSAGTIALTAATDPTGDYGSNSWNLIFGSGSTSTSSVRIGYTGGDGSAKTVIANVTEMTVVPGSFDFDSGTQTWKRDLKYTNAEGVDLTVTQSIKKNPKAADGKSQFYSINYNVKNNSAFDITADFMFHVDTAYNNNDTCEKYYTSGGNNISNVCMYTATADGSNANIHNGIPDSFSIINSDAALQFAEKIVTDSANKPDEVSFGPYASIRNWNYYNSLSSNLGGSTNRMDLGFSYIWKNDTIAVGGTSAYNLDYGIMEAATDTNLTGVTLTPDMSYRTIHESTKRLWIQSGAREGDGLFLDLEEMNSETIGLKGASCTDYQNASDAIDRSDRALEKISALRSKFGAYQNRLEHSMKVNELTSENTQKAESQIRDTDMAKEMVAYSKDNILVQAGMAMLAQAQSSKDSVLQLLQ